MTLVPGQTIVFLPAPDREARSGWFGYESATNGRLWITSTPGGTAGWWIEQHQIISAGPVPAEKGKRR